LEGFVVKTSFVKKFTSLLIVLLILLGAVLPASATNTDTIRPTESIDIDGVQPAEYLIINQVFGMANNSSGGRFSHSFVELYNPYDHEVDISSWSLQVAIRGNVWDKLDLEGTIPGRTSYLVRAHGRTGGDTTWYIDDYDQSWIARIDNNTFKVALVNHQNQLTTATPYAQDGVVDFVSGYNDDTIANFPDAFWGEGPNADISRQKSARRVDFIDTACNASDFKTIDYRPDRDMTPELYQEVRPRSLADGPWGTDIVIQLPPVDRPTGPREVTSGDIDFSHPAGLYGEAFPLRLSAVLPAGANTNGYTIRYTLDGEDPTATSTVFTTPINIRDRTLDDAPLSQINTYSVGGHVNILYPTPSNEIYQGTVVYLIAWGRV